MGIEKVPQADFDKSIADLKKQMEDDKKSLKKALDRKSDIEGVPAIFNSIKSALEVNGILKNALEIQQKATLKAAKNQSMEFMERILSCTIERDKTQTEEIVDIKTKALLTEKKDDIEKIISVFIKKKSRGKCRKHKKNSRC